MPLPLEFIPFFTVILALLILDWIVSASIREWWKRQHAFFDYTRSKTLIEASQALFPVYLLYVYYPKGNKRYMSAHITEMSLRIELVNRARALGFQLTGVTLPEQWSNVLDLVEKQELEFETSEVKFWDMGSLTNRSF